MNFKSAKMVRPGVYTVSDDAEVKCILVAYERADALSQHPDMPRLFIMWPDNEAGFFYVVTRYSGFPDAKDNGLVCWIIDMQRHTVEQLALLVTKIQLNGSTAPGVPLHFVEGDREAN